MDQVILQMKGICKAFAGVPALCNASLELKSGEVHALLGENGAGKSTTIKMMTGILIVVDFPAKLSAILVQMAQENLQQ